MSKKKAFTLKWEKINFPRYPFDECMRIKVGWELDFKLHGKWILQSELWSKITYNDTFSNALTRIYRVYINRPTHRNKQEQPHFNVNLLPPLSPRPAFFILQKHIFWILHISCPKEICFNLDCMLCHAVKFRSDDRHFQVSEPLLIVTCLRAPAMPCDRQFHI